MMMIDDDRVNGQSITKKEEALLYFCVVGCFIGGWPTT
jgi:hypothetical protein